MSGELDKIKGKVKEEAGRHTDDEDLEQEGKLDQGKGKAKEAWDDVKDAGENLKDAGKDIAR